MKRTKRHRPYRASDQRNDSLRRSLNGERIKNAVRDRRNRMRMMIDELKTRPCTDCGGVFDPICMDFDHRPGETKRSGVSELASNSRETILAEIAKCDLVCANCHRIRTFRKRNHAATRRPASTPQLDLAMNTDGVA